MEDNGDGKWDGPNDRDSPKFVRVLRGLEVAVKALMTLTAFEAPPNIQAHPVSGTPTYVVGDASGHGLGTSAWSPGTDNLCVEHGVWSARIRNSASSNFKEARNLVQRVQSLLANGTTPRGSELWVFTDNTTAKRCYYRGSSKSKLLHEIILNLRLMEMEGSLIMHFIWMSGLRMIAQGTDALSRGDLSSGVMGTKSFLAMLPLNLSVCGINDPS